MRLLALDTATEACSAALLVDGAVSHRWTCAPQQHAGLILPMLEALLDEAGMSVAALDGLAFGRGPGSFTGLRIAAGVAQGIAFVADLPVVRISTLAAMAQQALESEPEAAVIAALDARMGQVYWGVYTADEGGLARPLSGEGVSDPAAVKPPAAGPCWGVGSGFASYGEILAEAIGHGLVASDPGLLPDARFMLELGARDLRAGLGVVAEAALPVYLRDSVAAHPG